ncbi:MAG: protein-L-isoaspartate(D-aspartate) O-methyltransferase [Candidatus Marinimicrobia bacterium]|jgi:protein-L-isoaspartate(D-aspartate) O-methyltransferase|nr:protein-L-isoaspartate(D-aspartate) O-methyltransferase [Candidatus Neomarinimicrobiota bacterium]HJL74154.1 protein-L-isoaspartate(D-aspartate) O-methyltransferase [Candidatus Neomarinimicrobiota bacterium]
MHKPFIENMRKDMVENQLRQRGITDDRVLDAMGDVPRHLFVTEDLRDEAYMDGPLPIGFGQTISQPYIVAYMTEVLKVEQHHSVLEVGTGCGYQAAILSTLARNIVSLERIKELAESAQRRLQELGYTNVDVINTNGWHGYEKKAPYDRIIVTAGAKKIPQALLDQLSNNGIMIIPVGKIMFSQTLRIISKDSNGNVTKQTSLPVRFVRLVNK